MAFISIHYGKTNKQKSININKFSLENLSERLI